MHNFRISFLLFIPLFLKFYVMPCTLFINIKIASFFKLIIWTLITYTLHKIFNFNPTAIVSFLTCFYCAMRTIVSTHSFSPSPLQFGQYLNLCQSQSFMANPHRSHFIVVGLLYIHFPFRSVPAVRTTCFQAVLYMLRVMPFQP